jgi:cytochrome b involved in lipid metabolism
LCARLQPALDAYAQLGAGTVYASSHGVFDWTAQLDSETAVTKKRASSKKGWESNLISLEDLGRHRTSESLWVAIDGIVWE